MAFVYLNTRYKYFRTLLLSPLHRILRMGFSSIFSSETDKVQIYYFKMRSYVTKPNDVVSLESNND